MKRSRPLVLEQFEERCTPATFGNPWAEPQHLTLSFAPDGTAMGPYASQLNQHLDMAFGGPAWRREILRAFQTWAIHGNVNLSVTADSGLSLGTSGPIQGDDRFGDIRVSAARLSSLVLALEEPFDVTAGTWTGDLIFNTKHAFGNQPATGFDLYSVALHEAGHVFGLAHTDNLASPLAERYDGVRTGLIAEDIARLQALYGVRQADAYEGQGGNETSATATDLPLFGGAFTLPKPADITTPADKDFYRFVAAPLVSTTVRLLTHNTSLLTARLTVYNAAGQVVDSQVATDPASGNLAIQLPTSPFSKTYYIKVESGSNDVFGIGSYDVDARADQVNFSVEELRRSQAVAQDLLHEISNSTLDGSLGLGQLVMQTDQRFDYVYTARVSDPQDVDHFAFRSPLDVAGMPTVMTVMVWGLRPGQLDPRAAVFDAFGNAVGARVLVNEGGNYVLQVQNAAPNATYYVAARAYDPAGPRSTGDYFLGIDFSTATVRQRTLLSNIQGAGGLLTQSQNPGMTLDSRQDDLFSFNLTASAPMEMAIYNPQGQRIALLTAGAGETRSFTTFMGRGRYTIRLNGVGGLPAPQFTLQGSSLSDPVKPYEYDATEEPAGSSSGGGSSGGGGTQTGSSESYEGSYTYAAW